MNKKSIYITTNYNRKLDCPCFIHVDLAPANGIPESVKDNTVIEIKTTDASHLPVEVMLDDIARTELKNISTVITWQSHGMSADEFVNWMFNQNQNLTPESKMAVYMYRRINL